MSRHLTPIDISKMPDLVRIVEDMKQSKEPRILKKGNAPVAMLMPMETAAARHKTIDAFDFKPLENVKAELLAAGYPDAEVQDMIDAMSELPQYAGQDIQESH
jgi:hypothetical protein